MSGPGPHTPAGFLQATATETLKGGVTGGLGGAAGHVLTALGRTVLGKLRPQPPAPASAPKFSYSDKVMQQMTEDKYHGFPTILDEIICREGKCTIVPGYFKDPAPGMSDDSANWLFAFEGVVAEAY